MIYRKNFYWFIVTLFVALFVTLYQQAVSAEGNIGFNYNRAVNDASWGITGDYEHKVGIFGLGIDGDFQSGDIYRGTTDLSLSFDVSAVAIRFDSRNLLKGYDLSKLGRKNVIGVSLVIPIGSVEISGGIFGQDGNPFAPQSALGALTAAGFSETEFEGLGLENITLSEGISIEEGSSLLGGLETELDFDVADRDFNLSIQALIELLGEGERVHQGKANLSTNGEFIGGFDWQASLILETHLYPKVIEYETTWFIGLGYAFN